MQKQILMQLSDRPAPTMVRGAGAWLWDEHGRPYLDFVQGWAVNCLGHTPPEVRQAIEAQLARVINVGPAYHNDPAHELAEKLARESGLERAFFGCTGAEANETAVKLARKWGQKHKRGAYEVITTQDSFHGRTLAMTCATGKAGFDTAFPPAVPGFVKAAYGDPSAIEAAITPRSVAVMVEPIQGEAGVVVPPPGYLAALRTICDAHRLLLITDEIQTGMGRTGPMFAHQRDGIRPDIMTLGKGLGGGLPVSALLCRAEVACFEPGDHGGTFAAHSLLCAVACAVVDTLLEPVAKKLRHERAAQLAATLRTLADEQGWTVRGRGHLWALVLNGAHAATLRDRAFEEGLLLNAARPNVLRLMPPLNVTSDEIEEMARRLRRVLQGAAH